MANDSRTPCLESRQQAAFLKHPVDVVYRIDLLSREPPGISVEFRRFLGGPNSTPIPLQHFEELEKTIALFATKKSLLEMSDKKVHNVLKAEHGPIHVTGAYHKKHTVIIAHPGGTIQRDLNEKLSKELAQFVKSLQANAPKLSRK